MSTKATVANMEQAMREPFGGRWYGIFNVEGEGDPGALFQSRADAERDVERRRALPDERLTEYHQVLPCDLAGAVWNSFDPDPRAGNPLDASEILAVHDGTDVSALRTERDEARAWVRRMVHETRVLTCALGDAYAAASYQPEPLGVPVGLPWHAERGAPERPCLRCGADGGLPCWVSPRVNA